MGDINYHEAMELVVRQGLRPERPDIVEAPQLSDELWSVAESCWAGAPGDRLTANAVCDVVTHLLMTRNTLTGSVMGHQISQPPVLNHSHTVTGGGTNNMNTMPDPDSRAYKMRAFDACESLWYVQSTPIIACLNARFGIT